MTLPKGYSLPRSCVHSECRKSCKKQCSAHSEAADGSLPTEWTFLRHVSFCTLSQRPQCDLAPIVHPVHGLKHTLWLPSFLPSLPYPNPSQYFLGLSAFILCGARSRAALGKCSTMELHPNLSIDKLFTSLLCLFSLGRVLTRKPHGMRGRSEDSL